MADVEIDYTEDDIDAMKLSQARVLAKNTVDTEILKSVTNIQDIKCELKKHLKNRRRRCEVIKTLAKSKSYQSVCVELQNIYVRAKHLLDNNEVLQQFLEQCYGSQFDTFSSDLKKLADGLVECPILVLGQTGAGKSSFINLLLGEDILPTSTLSNTNTICEIRNSTGDIEIGAKFFPKTDTGFETQVVKCKDLNELRTLLQERIQKRDTDDDTQNSSHSASHKGYKKVQIHIPCDIMEETGLQIVDSPGIADTEEMTDVVHGYLSNAVGFIYIINSQDAGGIAPERLQELFRVVQKISLGDIMDYRPNCAIFVCNKWDQIPIAERKKVYDNTVQKLSSEKTGWPFFEKSSLFCLSSYQASKIQKSKEKWIVGSYGKLVEEIARLIPRARNIQILKPTCFIRQLLATALTNLYDQEEQSKMDPRGRNDHRGKVLRQLKALQTNVKHLADDQESMIKNEIKYIASDLSNYLLNKSQMEPMLTEALSTTRKDIPWKKNTIEIKKCLESQLRIKINEWNNENSRIRKLCESLSSTFREKFPQFDTSLLRILVKETSETDTMRRKEPGRKTAMQNDWRKEIRKRKTDVYSITGASFLAATVRLPVSTLKGIINIAEEKKMEIEYSTATDEEKKTILKRYAERAYMSQVKEEKVIEALQDQISVVVELYKKHKNKIMNEIKANKEFYKHEREPITEATPKRKEVQALLDSLIVFEKFSMPDDMYLEEEDVEYLDNSQTLSNGIYSSVGLIKVINRSLPAFGRTFYIRNHRFKVQTNDILSYMKEEAFALMSGKDFKGNATSFLRQGSSSDKYFIFPLFPVEEHGQMSSLRTYLEAGGIRNPNMVAREIAEGLAFLDVQDLVHIDLSMDTVLVSVTGEESKVKLVNFNCPKELHFQTEFESEPCIGKYAHFHPDLLCGKNKYDKHQYDMYSLGILILELAENDTMANIIAAKSIKVNDLPGLGRLMRKKLDSRENFQVASSEITEGIQACCKSKIDQIVLASSFLELEICKC